MSGNLSTMKVISKRFKHRGKTIQIRRVVPERPFPEQNQDEVIDFEFSHYYHCEEEAND